MATTTQRAARQAATSQQNGDGNGNGEKSVRLVGVLQITAPSNRVAQMRLVGISPLVMHKFSQKTLTEIEDKQREGSRSKQGSKRKPKDFDALYEGAKHISREGWVGIPASAFRCALISACRLVGFKMTLAKLSICIDADGFDKDEGIPLVRIIKGEPRPLKMAVRLATGVIDISCRPIWDEWEAIVRVRFDNDVFSVQDVTNLMARVGLQVGILEGRPDSRQSAGMGWGLFKVEEVVHD